MVWHRLESIVNGWSDRELAYCAFCFDLDVPCCLLNTVVIVCSVTWLCASLCMRVTTIFLIGVLFKRIAPRQHMFLHWTSIAETCKTWQQMASSTMRDSTEHDSLAHIVNLFCQKKKEKRREKKKSSSSPEVKWIDFKDAWAVRKLWNCLCRSIAELYNGAKVKQRSLHS